LAVVDPIQIMIQPLAGDAFCVEVSQDDLIGEIKTNINAKAASPTDGQHLFWGWRELLDRDTLRDWFIDANSVLHLVTPGSETEWKAKCDSGDTDAANPLLHVQIHNLVSKLICSLTVRRSDIIRDTIAGLGWFDANKLLSGQEPGLWLGGFGLAASSTFGDNSIREGTILHFEMERPYQVFVKTLTGRHITGCFAHSDLVETA
jgi:hypothetical protein